MRRTTGVTAAVTMVSLMSAAALVPAAFGGVKSGVVLSDSRVDFGDCAVGDVCHATLTYTNTTAGELLFDGVPQYSGQFGPLDASCSGFLASPSRLEPGGFCTDFLSFAPTEQKRYRGQACYSFVGIKQATVCARLVGRGV